MEARPLWPWLVLVGLGLFHGLNPAMGWLFAVGLGLQRGRGSAVLQALPPIALGHAASIAIVAALLALARAAIDTTLLRVAAALGLILFGGWRLVRGYRHQPRVGMQVGFFDLLLWSFLMATAHGAGLMVMPVLLELGSSPGGHLDHGSAIRPFAGSLATGLLAVTVHTLSMLVAAGLVAWVVFAWIGLAILRRAWINLDLLWSVALIGAGAISLLLAGIDLLPHASTHAH
jgi:hypothetical protein